VVALDHHYFAGDQRMKTALTLCFLLTAAPLSISQADDQQTETLHNNYYQDVAKGNGVCQTQCTLFFSATQHVTTVVTAVSCSFQIPSGTQILYAQLGNPISNAAFNLPIIYTGGAGNIAYLSINTQVQQFFNQGEQPKIFLQLNDASYIASLTCTISGYHS
jgi:hypothetical protein